MKTRYFYQIQWIYIVGTMNKFCKSIVYLLLTFLLFTCDSKNSESGELKSIKGIEWGMPFTKALEYVRRNEEGKKNPSGSKSHVIYRGNDIYIISVYHCLYEGIEGTMEYRFTPDSSNINQKLPRFTEVLFHNEDRRAEWTGAQYDTKSKIYDKVVSEDKKEFKELDSLYTDRYGKCNRDYSDKYIGGKTWYVGDRIVLNIENFSNAERNSYIPIAIRITLK